MAIGKTLRLLAKVLAAACLVAACGIALFVTVASVAEPVDAQELPAADRPEVEVWLGQPLPPPPEIVIERTLYAAVGDAAIPFSCTTPTSPSVDRVEDAGWACYSITNTGVGPVSTFTLADPDMRPAHVYVPWADGVDWIEPDETLVRQLEVTTSTAAFVSASDSSPVSYGDQSAQWATHEITSYELEFAPSCFCFFQQTSPPPYRITVVDGLIANAVSIETGNPAPAWAALTIDDMHARIAAAVDPSAPAWQTTGTIDLEYGIPTTWFIDEAANIADEEFGGTIMNFTPHTGVHVTSGDVDCNGKTDIIDALLIAMYDSHVAVDIGHCPAGAVSAAGIHAHAGDVDNDGDSNIIDALHIARCSVGIDTGYCHKMSMDDA